MELSDKSNPLTRPHTPLPSDLTPAEIAAKRFSVKGNAIVTGGCGNLGIEAARALLEHGASGVSLFDVNPVQAQDLVDTLRSDFPSAKIITKNVDVRDEQIVHHAVAETADELGSIDILLCFAGVVACNHALDVTLDQWKRTLDINTTGSWLCAQAAAKQMVKQGTGGSIVFTASISAHSVNFPQPQVSYNVSKGALLQLKSSLAAEWARYGIRVNSISPGYMDTVLNEGPELEEARHVWYSRNPMGRMGDASELTGVVILLCSRAGRYINGADILVDGGGSVF
ncbi:NAD(P)-binding protein [Rhizopogon vinicolor AM-OR11-026]|uniref:D-arabinitol 2-dehydrogenase [ribulose-forming] n=1 Tax=Rhizopogon vinicolor AM-OR11-026 TaxID=1314800 RepID=A0A1B7MVM6_9AGAM|nr:NAD(P)-binding protein [Rhizopogon vinicolor AM-OR11-026]